MRKFPRCLLLPPIGWTNKIWERYYTREDQNQLNIRFLQLHYKTHLYIWDKYLTSVTADDKHTVSMNIRTSQSVQQAINCQQPLWTALDLQTVHVKSVWLYTLVRVTCVDNADHTIFHPKAGSNMAAVAALSLSLTSKPELTQFPSNNHPENLCHQRRLHNFFPILVPVSQ